MNRSIQALRKIRRLGLGWGIARIRIEFSTPATPIGQFLRPVFHAIDQFVISPILDARAHYAAKNTATDRRLNFFLDLNVSPVTYDVATYLVGAELERRRLGASAIRVILVPGGNDGVREEETDYEIAIDRVNRRWRVRNLIVPLFELMPTVDSVVLCGDRSEATTRRANATHIYPTGYTTELPVPPDIWRIRATLAQVKDKCWPLLVAPEQAQRAVQGFIDAEIGNRHLIVITLREYDYNVKRNSRLDDWLAFAGELDPEIYAVLFIPDFDRALERRPEFETFLSIPQAAWNVPLRLALYERAEFCLAIGHGPMELAWYSETCRYLTFIEVDSAPQTTKKQLAAFGAQVGKTPAFARPWQRWVWRPDTLDNIRQAFSDMVAQGKAEGWPKNNGDHFA